MIAELAPGSVFAGYRVDGVVARGGMGVVYRAYDPGLERPVALKLIAPEVAGDPRFRERFLRETRIAASLEHPHVLPVYAAGEEGGVLFLATRFVEGEDLRTCLAREAPLDPERAVPIVARVAGALDAAHARGLVHRDVKPANVLLDASGECYLADFGLTKSVSSTSGLTRTGELVGTLEYLAPEQIRGQPLDGRADQYALACVLFECLAGKPPFRREIEAQALFAHLNDNPPALADRQLPAAIDGVLARGLAKEPGERFRSCSELVASAASALGVGVEFRRAPLLPAWVRRRAKRIALVGALVAAGAVAAAVVQLTGDSGSVGIRTVAANSVAAIDPETNAIVAQIPVGRRPTAIAVGEGAIWVLNAEDRTISRIDPETKEERRFATGTTPFDLVVGEGAVWVSSADAPREWPNRISRVDPDTGIVTPDTIELPVFGEVVPALGVTSGGTSMAVGEGALWAINPDGTISRIDPRSGNVVATIQGLDVNTIAVGEGAVWTANTDRTVSRIDPATNSIDLTVEVAAEGLSAIAVGAGAVWVTDPIAGTVWRVEPGGGRVVQKTIPLEFGAVGIAFGEGSVWVANAIEGTVSRIDPNTDQVVATVDLGNAPFNVAIGEGSVWVTVGDSGVPQAEEPPPTEGGVVALPATFCAELEGPEGASLLIASDLPLQGASQAQTHAIEAAIRHVLDRESFRAGEHVLAYQSCDDSTAQAGGWEVEKCASNAQAYAENPAVVAVIGAYNSGCSSIEIPFANRAPDGPLAMISPSNSELGLTGRSPGAPRGELERLYPTGVRNFVRVYPPDDAQAAALAQLAQELGLRRVFVLEDPASGTYGYDLAQLFEKAASELGVEIVGRRPWDAEAESYRVLAQRVAAADPDGVFLAGIVYSNAGRLVEDLRAELRPGVELLAPEGFSRIADLMEIVGPVADGMYISVQGVPTDRLGSKGTALLEELRAREPELNDYYALYGAQAAEVLLDAIARSDGTRTSVLEELFATEVENGIIGSFGFDENGDTTAASITILRVDGTGPGISHLSEDFAEGSTVDRVIEPDLGLVRE